MACRGFGAGLRPGPGRAPGWEGLRALGVVALFTVGLLLGPAPKLEAEGLGPFYLPPLGPSETFRAVPAFVVPASQTASEFTWYARVVNVWALNVASARPLSDMDNAYTVPFRYGAFLLDYEGYQVGLRSSYALSPRMRLEVDVPLYYVGSGHTDALIEGFHRTFGISQHRRDEWPRNQTHFLFVLPTGERLINSRQDMGGVFLGNVGLGATLELSQGNPGLGMRFLVHIPTTDAPDVFDENGSNATWQTVAHWRWWRSVPAACPPTRRAGLR